MSKISKQDIKQMRALGHKLKPVVTVAGNGLSEGVIAEIDRALSQHELIKIKLVVGSRDTKAELAAEICAHTGASLVQSIGNMILVMRRADQPDPRLSNLLRTL